MPEAHINPGITLHIAELIMLCIAYYLTRAVVCLVGNDRRIEQASSDFQPIIARSSSAVTPSEKSSINANSKSTMRFPMSLR